MKVIFHHSFTCIFLFLSQLSFAQDKVALIVGISNYPEHSGWWQLHAETDIEWIQQVLLRQGFSQKDIAVLRDQQATKKGILHAIRSQLIRKARPGGVAVFHFSGHGQQVCDDGDDELDRLDEALVPYDSPLEYQQGKYEGERLLRDDELGAELDKLREKLGPGGNLLVVLDACHSGTATRGQALTRGSDVVMAPKGFLEKNQEEIAIKETNFLSGPDDRLENRLAPMVVFSSTRAKEANIEILDTKDRPMGPLSFALGRALARAERHSTYRALFDQVRVIMNAVAPGQHPQAEGALDQEILGGNILGRPQYFTLSKKGWISGRKVKLNSGQLNGLFEGTKVEFHPFDTRDPEKSYPLASGKVQQAGLADCIVQLNTPLSRGQAQNTWVFIKEQSFGEFKIKVKVALPEGNLKSELTGLCREFPVIQLGEEQPNLIVEQRGSQVQLTTVGGFVFFQMGIGQSSTGYLANRLIRAILEFARSQFLQQLEMDEKSLDFELELVKANVSSTGNQRHGNPKTLRLNEEFKFKITNTGLKPAYFTVIDINPARSIEVILPEAGMPPEELLLEPGDQWETPDSYRINEPMGTGVLKLIASRQPMDLRSIETRPSGPRRGESLPSQGAGHPFAVLFEATDFYRTRSNGGTLKLSTEVEVSSIPYEFVR